jgi:hypothetical protein
MQRITRIFGPLFLGVGLTAVLVTYAAVVDDLPGRIYTPVQHAFLSYNRGRMIVQEAPILNYLSSAGEIVPAALIGDEHSVRATLIGRYEERDRVSVTVYDLDFRGEYRLAHSGAPSATVEWFFPFPANLDTLHDVRFLVGDREPDGVDYSTQGIRWTTRLETGEELDVAVSYRAQGASSFSYSLPRERRVDVDVIVTVEGLAGSESTQDFLRPTSAKEFQNGELFSWTYQNLIADRDIQLLLPAQLSFAQRVARLQGEFQVLSHLAPALVLAFLATLAALARLSDVRLRLEVYLIAGVGLALSYPLLTFLSGLVEIRLAALLSGALVFALLIAFLGRAAGRGQFRWPVGLLLLVFLGFFSLGMLTPWRGLSLTAGAVLLVVLFMALLTRHPAGPVFAAQQVREPLTPEPRTAEPKSGLEEEVLSSEPAQGPEPAGPHCPFCGNRLGETYRFCPACGHGTDQIAACSHCGSRQFIPAGQESVHCLACGGIVV